MPQDRSGDAVPFDPPFLQPGTSAGEMSEQEYILNADEHQFPFLLVGLTYVLGSAITGYVFLATSSFLWSTIAMFVSGLVVPAVLLFTPGVRQLFITKAAVEPIRIRSAAELKAWQDDLAMEELESDLMRQRLELAEERFKQVS